VGETVGSDDQQAGPALDPAGLRYVVEALPQIVWIARPDGWHVYFNQNWMDFTGLTLEESLGHGWNPPFHPDDRARSAAQWLRATRTGKPYEIEYRLRRHDGVYRWMLGRASPIRDAAGRIVQWFGTCTDIEELKQVQARAAEQAQLLDLTQDSIWVQDLDHRVLYWNRGAERNLGWTATEAVGRPLEELVAPDPVRLSAATDHVASHAEWAGELRLQDRSGRPRIVEGRWTLLRHEDGTPRAVLAVNTDVTEQRHQQAALLRELEAKALHDPLTGLANRALLFTELELLLARRQSLGVAVAFLDLDGFKQVNDTRGHRVGDEVLRHVATRLRQTVRAGDVAARIGGDEFVVVGEVADAAAALRLGERLSAAVTADAVVDGVQVPVSASIGVAFAESGAGTGASELLSRADATMYRGKRNAPGTAALEDGAVVRG
jgi:diguanylate cyclase (GGDEF)-like protein/PAS domain S-box-containing protein